MSVFWYYRPEQTEVGRVPNFHGEVRPCKKQKQKQNKKRSVTKWLFTRREEDPRRRITVAPYIYFLYSVYIQKVVLGCSARIFLAIGSSQLRDRKILALRRSKHHVNYLRSKGPSIRDKKKKKKHGGCRVFSCYRPATFLLFLLKNFGV